jgi:hypothetical protein
MTAQKRFLAAKRASRHLVRHHQEPLQPLPERAIRGVFEEESTYEFELQEDQRGNVRPMRRQAKPLRDTNADATKRLSRIAGLTEGQIAAGGFFERDHELAHFQQRVTANLMGSGGGAGRDLSTVAMEARDRKHAALKILRNGGADVVAVVDAVVLNGTTATDAGAGRYVKDSARRVWALAVLSIGLSLLEGHYRAEGRLT